MSQLLCAVLFLSCVPLLAFAQGSLSLSVSPTLYEMSANPGQIWSSNLRVINPNPYDLDVYVQVVNFAADGESGQGKFLPLVNDEVDAETLAGWVKFPETAVSIAPEQTKEIAFSIEVPENAPPGGHFAAIMVGTRPPRINGEKPKVETAQVVTSLVFLRVSGDVVEEGQIRTFRSTQSILERPEATFELRFQNTGNVHILPQGEIKIVNMWGETRGIVPVNRNTLFGNVLPESIRKFSFTWTGEWSLADIGRYRAIATLAYGENGRKFASSETAFWVIPWKPLLLVLSVLFGFIYFMTWAIKLYVRKMLSMAGVTPAYQRAHMMSAPAPVAESPKRVSVTAPLEQGMLDLRSRLRTAHGTERASSVLFEFVVRYKLFFLALLGLVLFVAFFVWFFVSASSDDRAYEVEIQTPESSMTVTSEDVAYEGVQGGTSEIVASSTYPEIKIINRSGVNGLAAEMRVALETAGVPVASLGTELDSVERNTVIVYDPAYAEDALKLSNLIDGALLSGVPAGVEIEAPLVIYVGSDYENAVQ